MGSIWKIVRNRSKAMLELVNSSLQLKLTTVFVFAIIIPLVLANYSASQRYSALVENTTLTSVDEITGNMVDRLEELIEDMKQVAVLTQYGLLTSYENEPTLWAHLQNPEVTLQKQRRVDFYVQMLNKVKRDSYSVYIYDIAGNFFFNNTKTGIRQGVLSIEPRWRQIAEEANGLPVVVSTRESTFGTKPTYLFSVVKMLKEIYAFKPVGMVVVDANVNVIEEAVEALDSMVHGRTVVVDADYNVIYDSDYRSIAKRLDEQSIALLSDDSAELSDVSVDGTDYLLVEKRSESLGWKVLVYIPKAELFHGIEHTRWSTQLVTLFITLVAFTLSIFITFTLTRPLRDMTGLMKRVQQGNLNVTFEVKNRDEIGLLGVNFNLMLKRINQLIYEVYSMRLRKNKAEMESLQNQINPHFIYNTLESIRMTASFNEDHEVADMIYILAKQLRYGINRDTDKPVSLREEIEHLELYMKLQNFRFSDRFALQIEVEKAPYWEYPLLRMMLQPIVENAIIHGLDDLEDGGRIIIRARPLDGQFLIEIEDNGIGMDASALNALRERVGVSSDGGAYAELHEDRGGGIGLRNVHQRIQLHYGEHYGVRIDSEPGVGTTVTLALPKDPPKSEIVDHAKGGAA